MRPLRYSFLLLLLGISLSACIGGDVAEEDSGTPISASDAGVQEPEQPIADDECITDDECSNGQSCHEKQCLTPSTSNDTFLCSNSDPCPAGQFCFNDLCAIGCLSNGDCASDQYCDTEGSMRCVNRVVETCPQTACEANQDCVDGYCVATAEPS
ncbi:MAG: hypothetical protein GY822_16850 [Deltaproteobacteria bacterium]|nr:hypothetical protein [Deltaproteobacteria bacterium]